MQVPLTFEVSCRRGAGRAFTLVEVMVAVAVVVLLTMLATLLVTNAGNVITGSGKRMLADTSSRLVFTRMAEDLDGMIRRPDADLFFVKNAGNDAFYFYSQTVGYYPGGEGPRSPFSLVGYRIANRGTPTAIAPNGVLERVGVGMGYDNSQSGKIMRFLSYPEATSALPHPLPLKESTLAWSQGANGNPTLGNKIGTAPTWDNPPFQASNQAPLSTQVFRMEFCFVMKDGTFYSPPAPGASPWEDGGFLNAMKRIKREATGLVVTMALLDERSQVMMDRTGAGTPDFSRAINLFADGGTPEVAAAWQSALEASLASPAGLQASLGMPLNSASQIRIYQRAFRLIPVLGHTP